MRYRIAAASFAAVAAFFVCYATAFACSPAPLEIHGIHPEDGATIAPTAAFTLRFGGSGNLTEVRLRDADGQAVELEQTESYTTGTFGRADVYKPTSPLEPGATYTFYAKGEHPESRRKEPRGQTELETTYTVEATDEQSSPPPPENLELYTVHRPNIASSCTSNQHQTELRFDEGPEAASKVGFYVVTFREKPAGESGGRTHSLLVQSSAGDGPALEASARLDFEPRCVAVDAYAPDRTAMSSVGTCTREVCAEADAENDLSLSDPWAELPACGDDQAASGALDGGCGGCRQGSGPIPNSVPAVLVGLIVVVGLRRRGSRQ